MSIEVTLYPSQGTRKELVAFLKARRYEPSRHFWEWPTGTVNLHWFEREDYTSFDGVEASVYQPSEEELLKYGGDCKWALHTRTRAGGSAGDRHQQNETIRAARKRFGGNFYNDWYGKNRYTPADASGQTPTARGLYMAYEHTRGIIESVKCALPNPIPSFANLTGTKLATLELSDPSRMLYNGLVPFAVAALEHFFSQAFKILLQYDAGAKKRLASQISKKVDFADALALSKKEKAIEDIVADWYSFQSLDGIQKAFSEWLDIDIWKLLRQKRKVGRRIDWLEKRFKDLIKFRHGVVHQFEVDPTLTKEGIEEIFDLSISIVDAFIDHIESSRGENIRGLL
jgi:hypothetical protein